MTQLHPPIYKGLQATHALAVWPALQALQGDLAKVYMLCRILAIQGQQHLQAAPASVGVQDLQAGMSEDPIMLRMGSLSRLPNHKPYGLFSGKC